MREIAAELDSARFALKDHLQRAHWQPIADYNRKFPKRAIKNFSEAVSNRKFVYPNTPPLICRPRPLSEGSRPYSFVKKRAF